MIEFVNSLLQGVANGVVIVAGLLYVRDRNRQERSRRDQLAALLRHSREAEGLPAVQASAQITPRGRPQ